MTIRVWEGSIPSIFTMLKPPRSTYQAVPRFRPQSPDLAISMITRIISIRRTLGVVMLTIATAAVCPEPARSEPIEPKAELRLEIPHHKRAHGEAFEIILTVETTGQAPIPIIDDKNLGIISTRQLFIVSTILELNENRPLHGRPLDVGDNVPI